LSTAGEMDDGFSLLLPEKLRLLRSRFSFLNGVFSGRSEEFVCSSNLLVKGFLPEKLRLSSAESSFLLKEGFSDENFLKPEGRFSSPLSLLNFLSPVNEEPLLRKEGFSESDEDFLKPEGRFSSPLSLLNFLSPVNEEPLLRKEGFSESDFLKREGRASPGPVRLNFPPRESDEERLRGVNDCESSRLRKGDFSESDFLNPDLLSGLGRSDFLPRDGPLSSKDFLPELDLDGPLRLRDDPDESDLGIGFF
jgi:hypothetical protein